MLINLLKEFVPNVKKTIEATMAKYFDTMCVKRWEWNTKTSAAKTDQQTVRPA